MRSSKICKNSQAGKLNFSETFPNDILDSFVLGLKYTKEELETLNEENVKKIMLHVMETPNKSFKIQDGVKYWKENIQDENDKTEEKINEVTVNLRKFILNSMINGKIKFYCSENETIPF